MAEKRKFVNSYDVATDHGNVWIHSLGGEDYRDKKMAWWAVVAPKGRAFKADPNEKLYLKETSQYHVFATFDDAAAWCEKHYMITGFKRDKFGGFHPDEVAHDHPCGRRMSKDHGRWTSFSVCDRLSIDDAECKLHRSIDLRLATKKAAADEKKNANDERSSAGKKIAQDAIDALAEESMKATPRGRMSGYDYIYTGEVTVHAEDVLKMVRELRHLREMLGR